jgi:hypothetical protein
MYGDMSYPQDLDSVWQSRSSTGRLTTGVIDRLHWLSASFPTSTIWLDYKDADGDPYNIGPVTGSVFVDSNAETTMSVTLSNSNFYVRKMGGITTNERIAADFLDPDVKTTLVSTFEGTASSPSTVSAKTPLRVLVFDSNGNAAECTSRSSPLSSCGGMWFSYHFIEVCPKNEFATKAPTPATPPSTLATPAPTAATPLIDVVFTNANTAPAMRKAFEDARDFWNEIIHNTHEPLYIPAWAAGSARGLGCSASSVFPAGTTELKGLTIFATIGPIDGAGLTLGQAGPCAFSYVGATETAFGSMMPRVGEMEFDEADLQGMVDDGTLGRVILHEMGHVLGLGTLWHKFRQGSASDAANDPRYVGVNGNEGYKAIGGLRSTIPISNTGGGGTADSHWRESTFADELMSGYATGAMPASIMTIKTLKDLGYSVDESKAEAYTVPLSNASAIKGAKAPVSLGDDIMVFNGKVHNLPSTFEGH